MSESNEVLVSNITDEIQFVETDSEVINADLVRRFEEYLGETLASGDERRMFLQGFAYALADQLNHINETGRSNLLRYAVGNELDALGDLYHNQRHGAERASVTMRYTLSSVQSHAVTVPAGTRVTPDGTIFFATDEQITFNPNSTELTKDVTATATVAGNSHNDLAVGTIKILVDTNAYIAKVENITVSGGGSDVETDDEYRQRLRESPFSFSVAGPANAYKAIAMSVSGDVADASVYSPSAGTVEIAVIKDGGEIPTEDDELLSMILEACDDKTVRPLTDYVKVVPATAVAANIIVTYYVASDDTSTKNAVEAAVEEYKKWQTEKIGRAISPDKLNYLMYAAGAARVAISEPTYKALAENEVAQIGTITVTCGGLISI